MSANKSHQKMFDKELGALGFLRTLTNETQVCSNYLLHSNVESVTILVIYRF